MNIIKNSWSIKVIDNRIKVIGKIVFIVFIVFIA
jgi:hypothetical protein